MFTYVILPPKIIDVIVLLSAFKPLHPPPPTRTHIFLNTIKYICE